MTAENGRSPMSAQSVDDMDGADRHFEILNDLGLSRLAVASVNTWSIGGHQVVSVVVVITPEMARKWLDDRNPSIRDIAEGNRKIVAKVATYAEEMRLNAWRTSPQNVIAFDEMGVLLDGQHRLMAISRQDVGQEFMVQVGWPRSAFASIDTGVIRQARQFASGKYADKRTAAARIVAAISGMAPPHDIVSARPLNNEVELEWLAAWPEIDALAPVVGKCYTETRINHSLHLAIMAMASRTQHGSMINSWMTGLTDGVGLAASDPRLHLRNKWLRDSRALSASGSNRIAGYITITKMWNAFVTGQPVALLKTSSSESVPNIIGFRKLRITAS